MTNNIQSVEDVVKGFTRLKDEGVEIRALVSSLLTHLEEKIEKEKYVPQDKDTWIDATNKRLANAASQEAIEIIRKAKV